MLTAPHVSRFAFTYVTGAVRFFVRFCMVRCNVRVYNRPWPSAMVSWRRSSRWAAGRWDARFHIFFEEKKTTRGDLELTRENEARSKFVFLCTMVFDGLLAAIMKNRNLEQKKRRVDACTLAEEKSGNSNPNNCIAGYADECFKYCGRQTLRESYLPLFRAVDCVIASLPSQFKVGLPKRLNAGVGSGR